MVKKEDVKIKQEDEQAEVGGLILPKKSKEAGFKVPAPKTSSLGTSVFVMSAGTYCRGPQTYHNLVRNATFVSFSIKLLFIQVWTYLQGKSALSKANLSPQVGSHLTG